MDTLPKLNLALTTIYSSKRSTSLKYYTIKMYYLADTAWSHESPLRIQRTKVRF